MRKILEDAGSLAMKKWVYGGLVAAAIALAGANDIVRVRLAAGAPAYYPKDPAALRAAVEQYLNAGGAPAAPGRLFAVVAPQSIYPYSGAIAGRAFSYVQPGAFDRVIILAPSNFTSFRGCSIPSVFSYETPLGRVALDGPVIGRLTWNALISTRALTYDPDMYRFRRYVPLHEREHGDEVQLPFLQARLADFKIVPVITGDFIDHHGQRDTGAIESVALSLAEHLTPRTLVVVSTDFTRYGERVGYRPFQDDVLANIERLDRQAFSYVLEGDYEGFEQYLDETRNPINGQIPLDILMRLLPPGAKGELLAYDTSGRIKGDTRSSVSFAAMAFFDMRRPESAERAAVSSPGAP